MILIFLGNWRMTLIASMSIPLAILGAVIGLYVTGNTINAMTLGGLALAIGPLVDDAIVALENIHRHGTHGQVAPAGRPGRLRRGHGAGAGRHLHDIIVLAPLALMPGMGGFLFRPLALAVAFAMVTSFVLSRTFVPMMCAKFLGKEHGSRTCRGRERPRPRPRRAERRPVRRPSTTASSASWMRVTRGYTAAAGTGL